MEADCPSQVQAAGSGRVLGAGYLIGGSSGVGSMWHVRFSVSTVGAWSLIDAIPFCTAVSGVGQVHEAADDRRCGNGFDEGIGGS